MINWLFKICVNFLNWLGSVTGFSYVEISVIFNLWIQAGILVVSALVPFMLSLSQYFRNSGNFTTTVLTGTLLGMYSAIFVWVICHYSTNMKYAFELCVNDLLHLARLCHTSYNMVNIIIFVVGWILAFAVNVFITWKLLRWVL